MNENAEWRETEDSLQRRLVFKDFSEAFAFMVRAAMEAERLNHHPTWKNTWNTVDILLTTHDAGNKVTEKDRDLAYAIDRILGEVKSR